MTFNQRKAIRYQFVCTGLGGLLLGSGVSFLVQGIWPLTVIMWTIGIPLLWLGWVILRMRQREKNYYGPTRM